MKSLKEIGFDNYAVTRCGKIYSFNSNKFLKHKVDRYGYEAVCLRAGNENHHRTVHRLVATAYLGGVREDLTVNHIDGDKRRNEVTNLEWVSGRENTRHAMTKGLTVGTVTSDEDVHKICSLIQDGYRNCDIKMMVGIETITTVEKIRSGESYKDISVEYDFQKNSLGRRQTISVPKVLDVCLRLQEKQSVTRISREVGVSSGTVYRVKNRTRYTKISNNYEW